MTNMLPVSVKLFSSRQNFKIYCKVLRGFRFVLEEKIKFASQSAAGTMIDWPITGNKFLRFIKIEIYSGCGAVGSAFRFRTGNDVRWLFK